MSFKSVTTAIKTPRSSSSPSSLPFTDAPRAYLAAIPCALTAFLGVVVLVLLAFISSRSSPFTVRIIDIEHDARVLCSNVACREVTAMLALTADRSVRPCDNFHQHVCGNWAAGVSQLNTAAKSGRMLNYAEVNLRSFSDRVHRSLGHLTQSPVLGTPQESQMARFYKSCLHFVSNRSQSERWPLVQIVLERAEIDRHPWEDAISLLGLLEAVVGSCLRTGLTSVLSARRSRDGDIFVDLGESLRHTLQADRGEHRVRHFLLQSLTDLRRDGRSYTHDEILALDAKVEDVRENLDASKRHFEAVQLANLPSPLSELRSLAEPANPDRASTTSMHRQSSLRVRALEKIVQVIELLGAVNLRLAGVYLLLVTVSQVLKYGYMLLQPRGQYHESAVK
ncbi:hypothetical protein V5799_020169, partial [Amblyomma americanum]